jgi:membrane associated rhomboid family serine protease
MARPVKEQIIGHLVGGTLAREGSGVSIRNMRNALIVMVAFLALLWAIQVANWADGYRLDGSFGILPHHLARLPDIFTAPFLHVSWQHIEGNSIPLFVLGFLAAYRGIKKFLLVTLVVTIVSGLGVWLFQSSGLTVGASGIIFGYFGYVLLRGIFDRNILDIVMGVIAGLLYWGILAVAIPGTPGISWIAHLSGLVGGVLAAWFLRDTRSRRGIMAGPDGTAGVAGLGAAGTDTGAARASGAARTSGPANDGRTVPVTTVSRDGKGGKNKPGSQDDGSVEDLLRQIDDMGI